MDYRKKEQTVIDVKDIDTKGNPTARGNVATVTQVVKRDKEEEELRVQLEISIVITALVIFLITYSYIGYIGP